VLHARTHKREIRLEIQLEHLEGLFDVGCRGGDCHQRQHRVALADMVFDPLAIDGDVALEKVETAFRQQVGDAISLHIHAVDFPVGAGDDALGQVMPDESIDAEDQYLFMDAR
jgi:hypothetical protein